MSWLKTQWRGSRSVRAVLFVVSPIVGLPVAAYLFLAFYAATFDTKMFLTMTFARENFALMLRELPDLVAMLVIMSGVLMAALPFAIIFAAVILGAHQLIVIMMIKCGRENRQPS